MNNFSGHVTALAVRRDDLGLIVALGYRSDVKLAVMTEEDDDDDDAEQSYARIEKYLR